MPNNFWKKLIPFWLAILIIAVVAAIVFLMVSSRAKIPFPEPVEIIKAPKVVSPEIPLASGKQTYEILTDASRRFKIIEVELDPLDAKQGEGQMVTIQVKDIDNEPITQENKVTGLVYTDNTSTPFSFSLKKVEDVDGATVTTWEGLWVCQDTYGVIYTMTIKAKSAAQEHSIDLTFE